MKFQTFSRAVAVVTASALFFSSSFAGMMAIGESISQALRNIAPGQYTERPHAPYLGLHPGRSPKTRGGLWSAKALDAAERSGSLLQTSMQPFLPPVQHSLAVAPEPGSSLPWEGSFGSVNSGNGNKLTSLHLFSWKARGGMPVDFTLYHNSQTNYNDELGAGWSWTYDLYINVDPVTGTATVHYGNGLSIPYTVSGGVYSAPTGIFESLVKNGGGLGP